MKNSFCKILPATAAVVALLSGFAQGQDDNSTTVINVFWITETVLSLNPINQYPLAGSIVTANSASTVVAVECAGSSIDTEICGTEPNTITYGSTTWIASDSTANVAATLECSIAQNSESAVCKGEIAAPEQIFTDPLLDPSEESALLTATTVHMLSTAYSGTVSSTDFTFMPITITAGQDKLADASSAADSSSSSGGGDGNGAGSLKTNLGLSGLIAGLLGLVMMAL
ncbi:hypothetical protein PV04_08031 [Phialophora macrospora]|uniref:Ig-like domain-containing protein n=1 Tax=Phialophora macrospora TaxID=1851006 RepID=A0A0D2FCQ9_9EURO|nr:hypothetical protein PV04_08031 [Phialophora macrospora]